MKTLIVEDDFTCRLLLQEILKQYGQVDIAVNGREAVEAVRVALEIGSPYDLVCMDIKMPEMDGLAALKSIRDHEGKSPHLANSTRSGAKIIMVTALGDMKNIFTAFSSFCDAYLKKPIDKAKLLETLHKLHLIS